MTMSVSPQPATPETVSVNLTVNGATHALVLDPRTTLLDLLREHLNLTGTKKGCAQGQCGACTVLVDGRRINSCLPFAIMFAGFNITTIEGVATRGRLPPQQLVFFDHAASQGVYCAAGKISPGGGLTGGGRGKTADDIRELMS